MSIPVMFRRLPLVVGAMFVLLVGMWAGLLRIGWNWPGAPVMAMVYHGPLMVGGFLGTLISLERAVALRRIWPYGAPLASAAGGICLLAGLDPAIGEWLLLIASALLVAVFVRLIIQQPTMFLTVMGLGAVAWLAGNLVWTEKQIVPLAVPWWIAFLVLTIVGERLELTRLLPHARGRTPSFVVACGIYGAGLVVGLWWHGLGWAIAGAGLVSVAAWLARFDLARRTIHQKGLTRFVAACLLSGYFWLCAGGVLTIVYAAILPLLASAGGSSWLAIGPGGMAYDAILHAVLLGFVFTMIFGHAPIIFPAVLSIQILYRPRFYGHLALLHLSVLARVISDMCNWSAGRQWAGLFNAISILLFLANTIMAVRGHRALADAKARPFSARAAGASHPATLSLPRHPS